VGDVLFSGAGKPNQAQVDFKPIAAKMLALNAHQICDRGDNGHGIDNTIPWYTAYYSVPGDSKLDGQIANVATGNGYKLSGPDGQQETKYTKGTDVLEVKIVHSGPMEMDCGDATAYGRQQNPALGTALVMLSLTEASTQN
jgi:hypothetical protein